MLMMEEPISLSITDRDRVSFHVVLLGVGGTGGYVLRSLVRMAHSYQAVSNTKIHITICDGDAVEAKNTLRQDFVDDDIHKKKVDVLARRFGSAYGLTIRKRDSYVEDIDTLRKLCYFPNVEDDYTSFKQLVIVGCVDNNATRQLLNQFFHEQNDLIYIDAGNEGIKVTDKLNEELTEEEKAEIDQSGYAGQCVIGWKRLGKIILPPVGYLYEDILGDKETFFPSQSCGREIVNNPQRRMTNEVSAMVVTSYLNNLFGQREIVSHETTFNARTMMTYPKFITKSYMEHLAGMHK